MLRFHKIPWHLHTQTPERPDLLAGAFVMREATMRLTLTLLGLELDLTLGRQTPDTDDEPADDHRGSFTSYLVGFIRDPDVPWEDRGSLHQYDPDETSEDT